VSRVIQQTQIAVERTDSKLAFETTGAGGWPVWHRWLTIDGRRAYDLGNTCNTCAFWFERLEGAHGSLTTGDLAETLADGLEQLNPDLIAAVGAQVPVGSYEVVLLEAIPHAVTLASKNDYFANEQVRSWGIDAFWGLPHWPKVPYYRAGSYSISEDEFLYEFIVPMFPRTQLNAERIDFYVDSIKRGAVPAAIALSILDVKQPAMPYEGCDGAAHWCLAHYLIDGHHKIEAAAHAGKAIRLLSFLAVAEGISTPEEVLAAISHLNTAQSA
jgi:hypothetical protein